MLSRCTTKASIYVYNETNFHHTLKKRGMFEGEGRCNHGREGETLQNRKLRSGNMKRG